MTKPPRIEIVRATVHSLKRDRAFWKRRAELNIKNVLEGVEEIMNNPDRKQTSLTELKKLIISKRSGLDKFITVQIKLSDLFQVIGEIKDEAKMWREANELRTRIEEIEKYLEAHKGVKDEN